MQARKPRPPLLVIAAVWLATGAFSVTGARVTMAKPSLPASSLGPPADAISGPLPSQTAESRIRMLAASVRPAAAAELADLSLSLEVSGRAQTLLLAIRALGRSSAPAAQQALLHHLREPRPGDEPVRRSLARATAALALAARGQPEGVRALVLLASGPDDADTALKELSRAALLAHPPDNEQLKAALPWLDDEGRRVRVAWMAEELTLQQKWQGERCKQAHSQLARMHELPSAVAAEALVDLAGCAPGAELELDVLQKVAQKSPLWALRGAAALGLGADDREWQELAETKLARGDQTTRSAAAWFLSTTNPTTAERLAQDPRPEVRAAARNQLTAAGLGPDPSQSACPAALGESSTSGLFRYFLAGPVAAGEPVLGCLASRLRMQPGAGLTAAELEALVEGGPAVTRLVVAQGLGDAKPEARALARGLSERLYGLETDGYVRRSLCAALMKLGLGKEQALAREMADLDPDPVCRALAAGRPHAPTGSSLLATMTTAKRYLAARVLAPPVSLEPAPDGFVGARVATGTLRTTFDPHFVDCQESGQPGWACGPTALRPR